VTSWNASLVTSQNGPDTDGDAVTWHIDRADKAFRFGQIEASGQSEDVI